MPGLPVGPAVSAKRVPSGDQEGSVFTHCMLGALMTRVGDWPCGPATKMSIVPLLEEANAMRPSGPLLAAPSAPRTLVMTFAASP